MKKSHKSSYFCLSWTKANLYITVPLKKSKYLCFWKHIISELGLIYRWQSTEAENKCEDFTQSALGNKGWRWMGGCKQLFIMVPSNSKFNYEALQLRQFAFKTSHWSLKFWWKTFFLAFIFLFKLTKQHCIVVPSLSKAPAYIIVYHYLIHLSLTTKIITNSDAGEAWELVLS